MVRHEVPIYLKGLRVKDTKEKQLRVWVHRIGFVTAVQSMMIVTVSIGRVWVDLCNYYEMRELS